MVGITNFREYGQADEVSHLKVMHAQSELPRDTAARPVSRATYDLVQHLYRQRAFSRATFGPGNRTKGVIDHIRQELVEIESDPLDIFEWVDVILLALDGAWRTGFTPEQIASALEAKQSKNEQRDWPDWRTADPDRAINHQRH